GNDRRGHRLRQRAARAGMGGAAGGRGGLIYHAKAQRRQEVELAAKPLSHSKVPPRATWQLQVASPQKLHLGAFAPLREIPLSPAFRVKILRSGTKNFVPPLFFWNKQNT